MIDISTAAAKKFNEGRLLQHSKGDAIIRNSETSADVYQLVSGWAQVASVCQSGESNILYTLYEGDIFPLPWTTSDQLVSVTYTALSNTNTRRISYASFQEAMKKSGSFSTDIMSNLAEQHQRFANEKDNLNFRTAGQRVAFRIVTLANHFGRVTDRGIFITYPVTNEYIARSSNMTRETASREMAKLSRRKIISIQRGHIFILNKHALRNIISNNETKTMHLLT